MGLDTVELVLAVEEIFGIEIPNDVAANIFTVGALNEFIVAELNRLQRPDVNKDIVYDLLRNIIVIQLAVKPEEVIPSARFIQDLHAD
jgi:acyl carrier protein